MKNIISNLAVIGLLMLTTQLQAQNITSKKNNYLILSKNIEQLDPTLVTANDLAKEDGKKHGAVYVIICGKTVSDIPNNPVFNKLLERASEKNVKVFACGISLRKFSVNPDQLPENLEITENGILYGFQLKKQGFITLSI